MSVRRAPIRSARTLAQGPQTRGVENCAQVTKPTVRTEWVN